MRRLDTVAKAAVADTCAVWNVLSSALLHRTCKRLSVEFALTGFVLYECLHKARKERSDADDRLKERLRSARERGEFKHYDLTVEDLQEVARLESRKRVSKGELSAIAFAKRVGLAFQSDDMGARKLGESLLEPDRVQTTPHLLGWLFFGGHLVDGDLRVIIDEHESFARPLGRYFEEAYLEAMRCRLIVTQGGGGG